LRFALQTTLNRRTLPWFGLINPPSQASLARTDVRETDDEVLISVGMPGLEEKYFELNLTGDMLSRRLLATPSKHRRCELELA